MNLFRHKILQNLVLSIWTFLFGYFHLLDATYIMKSIDNEWTKYIVFKHQQFYPEPTFIIANDVIFAGHHPNRAPVQSEEDLQLKFKLVNVIIPVIPTLLAAIFLLLCLFCLSLDSKQQKFFNLQNTIISQSFTNTYHNCVHTNLITQYFSSNLV